MDASEIKARQQWVLRYPCESVTQCGRDGYRRDIVAGNTTIATTLTIDLFTKPIAWHATIGIFRNGQLTPVTQWEEHESGTALALATELLRNVGDAAQQTIEGDAFTLGYARAVTPAEMSAAIEALPRVKSFRPKPVAIGEIGEYDFGNRKTQVGDGLFQPEERTLIYAAGK